ncbi:MAG: YicC/YloC family endoribonuclease [Alphaproteobacteria bacterium]
MPIASMTGFSRSAGQLEPDSWSWEVKSVNARGLDVRCRFPAGMDSLEPEVRRRVAERFSRGAVNLTLQVTSASRRSRFEVNREALAQIEAVMGELSDELQIDPPRIDGLLNIRGVVDLVEEEDSAEEREAREQAVLASLDTALDGLSTAREEEGAHIAAVLDSQLEEIAALVDAAVGCEEARPERLRERLKAMLSDVLDEASALSEDRLAQEVALLLIKADVREEIDRLSAHIASARDLLAEGGPSGRRLDFLCQEFNRESNTLCSKASEVDLTRIGLDLKAVIEQFREQVQNVE